MSLKRLGDRFHFWRWHVSHGTKASTRPHWLTVLIGLLSPSVALVAVYLSLRSIAISENAMKVGQRAYVSVVNVLVNKSPNSEADEIRVVLRNMGNTPAKLKALTVDLRAVKQSDLGLVLRSAAEKNTRTAPFIHRIPVLSLALEIAPKGDAVLELPCGKGILDGLDGKMAVAGMFHYYDVFGDQHQVAWGWEMDKFRVMRPLTSFNVSTILLFSNLLPDMGEFEEKHNIPSTMEAH